MLKVVLAAQKSSDAVIVDGQFLTRNIHFIYEGPRIRSLCVSHTFGGKEIKLKFAAEALEKARFNDVTAAFELFDPNGRLTTLNFQRLTPILESNIRLREFVTKQQYSKLSKEELDELDSFIEEESLY